MLLALATTVAMAQPFTLEFDQGAVLGPGRVVGLAGAYTAVAEGMPGYLVNPAAVAVRTWRNAERPLALDVGLTVQSLPVFTRLQAASVEDGDGTGFLGQGGLGLKLRSSGLGLHGYGQSLLFQFEDPGGTTRRGQVSHGIFGLTLGQAFWGGRLVLGASALLLVGGIEAATGPGELTPIASAVGFGAEAGVLYADPRSGLRLGLKLRPPFRTSNGEAEGEVAKLIDGIRVPFEGRLGIAWSFGSDWNRPSTYGERDAPGAPGRSVLVSLDLVLTGPSADAVSVADLLSEETDVVGAGWTPAFHLGSEGTILPEWLRVRAGTYWEPGRYQGTSGRLHGTAGLDVGLFTFPRERTRWRVSGTVDGADGYFKFGFGFGGW